MNTLHANEVNSYNILLIEGNSKEAELYGDVIREVVNTKLDIMGRIGESFDWILHGNYHLIVIDLSSFEDLPVTELDLLERIRSASPTTSVIILSEYATVKNAVSAIRMGADDFIKKPFDLESFKLAIKRSLDKKDVFSEVSGASEFLNLLNCCQMISASMEVDNILKIVQSYLSRELQSKYSAIYVLRDGVPAREARSQEKNNRDDALDELIDITVHASNPFQEMYDQAETYRFIDRSKVSPNLFVFHFRCAGRGDYFCVCLAPVIPDSVEAFESRLHLLKRQIEVTGNNIRQYMGVQHLVYVDDATGLYNTRYMNFILDKVIHQSEENDQTFAVLFIDGDRFKSVNDEHGHLTGTRILNALGHHLKVLSRDSDTVFRYGGDEFVAVLAPCDKKTAKAVANRIRKSIEKERFLEEDGKHIRVTVSIGVALFPEHAKTQKEIIEMADQAMYEAKKVSRNRVYICDDQLQEKNREKKGSA